MDINDREFILIIESLRSTREMVDRDTIWTANIKDRRNGELSMLINRLADEYQQIHGDTNGESTTADVYNEQYLKQISDSDEEED